MPFRSICFAVILLTSLTGLPAADSPSTQATSQSQPEYILQPFDLIQVEVFQELDLQREVRLSQESTVTLPLIGTIDLTGKSVRQAQDAIRALYDRDYLVNPQINVRVLEYAKENVSVLGAVNTPGAIQIPPLEPPLKLLDAITRAGGFNRFADRKHVKLSRIIGDGKTSTFIINADDIIQSNTSDSWVLQKGDVIFVGKKIL